MKAVGAIGALYPKRGIQKKVPIYKNEGATSAGLLISDAFSTVPYCPTSVSYGFLLRHRGRHPLFSSFSELFESSAPLVWRKEGSGGGGGGAMCQPRAKRGHASSLFFSFRRRRRNVEFLLFFSRGLRNT